MATRRRKKNQEDKLIDIVETRNTIRAFFEDNERIIYGIVGGLALLVGGYFAYLNLYKYPRQTQAEEQMYQAQFQFEQDSFARALNNPGAGYPGFLQIIDDYGGTEAGNLAKYYAGVSYLQLGRYEDAIEYLGKYSPGGEVTPVMKHGLLGDAWSELNDYDKAISQYRKAINRSDNAYLSSYYIKKLAMLYEFQGNPEEALELYKRIKEEYPESVEAGDIDKYIARLEK